MKEETWLKRFYASILGLVFLLSCTYGTGIQKETGESPMVRGDSGGMDPGELGGSPSPLNAVKGWSGGGEMVSGDSAITQGLQANFKDADTYTVSFGLTVIDQVPSTGGNFATLRAIALLKWSVQGNTVVRKVTVSDGVSLTCAAEGVTIVIYDETIASGILKLKQKYRVSVIIAPGTRGSDEVPPTLLFEGPNNGGIINLPPGVQNFAVPQGVGIKSVLVTVASLGVPIPEQGVQVYQLASNNLALAAYDPRSMLFAPLVVGCAVLRLVNNTAADLNVQIIFGIDG